MLLIKKVLISDHPVWLLSVSAFVTPLCRPPLSLSGLAWPLFVHGGALPYPSSQMWEGMPAETEGDYMKVTVASISKLAVCWAARPLLWAYVSRMRGMQRQWQVAACTPTSGCDREGWVPSGRADPFEPSKPALHPWNQTQGNMERSKEPQKREGRH